MASAARMAVNVQRRSSLAMEHWSQTLTGAASRRLFDSRPAAREGCARASAARNQTLRCFETLAITRTNAKTLAAANQSIGVARGSPLAVAADALRARACALRPRTRVRPEHRRDALSALRSSTRH